MKHPKVTAESFLRDVAEHRITVVHEHGVHRHIRCQKQDGCPFYSFDVVTWPGYLTVTGDMGSYTWCRVDDMFRFFRRPDLVINPGYWTEKLVGVCRTDGLREFDIERVKENCRDHLRDLELTRGQMREALTFLRDEVWRAESVGYVLETLEDFKLEGEDHCLFQDAWEWCKCESLTYRAVWCMYAAVWTIKQYDALKAAGASNGEQAPS